MSHKKIQGRDAWGQGKTEGYYGQIGNTKKKEG